MRKVHLDFESRSKADIWSCGAYVYASHSSTEIMCVAYAVDDGPVKIIRRHDILMCALIDPFEELRALAFDKETLFYAHNALFEQLIWEHKLNRDLNQLPLLPVSRWRCTAAKALAHGLPKALQDVAVALGTRQQKDREGKAVMLKVCKPKSDGTWEESPELISRLEDYCAQDVETEREIDHRLPELEPFEQQVWFEDQVINRRGIAVDKEALDKSLVLISEETVLLKKEIVKLTGGKLEGVSRRAAVLDYFARKGVKLPDFTKATVEKALRSGQIPQDLAQVLRIRQQLGLTSTAKYEALREALCEDSRLRDTLVYHSASTGRWGGKLVQLQNLPRGVIKDTGTAVETIKTFDIDIIRMLYGDVMGTLSSCIRGMFVAGPGNELVISDYAAIEARVAMWFSGQADAVKMFVDGVDIYVEMAKRIGSGADRRLGKQTVLGCGYGMGHKKFAATCATYGIVISEELAKKAVDAYRNSFRNVVNMWYAQERAMRAAISTGAPVTCGRVRWAWGRGKEFLYCYLPSGRALAYHKAEMKNDRITYMTTNSTTKKYQREETYGGKIFENCLTSDTLVITMEGVRQIIDVKKGDQVWDGKNWVATDGVVKRGTKETGELAGIRLTADHKILVGNSWKSAINVDENSWQDALKSGRSLMACGLSQIPSGTLPELLVGVLVAQSLVSVIGRYIGDMHAVGTAAIKTAEQNGEVSFHHTSCPYGRTAIQEWCLDAMTCATRRTKTMAAGVLRYIQNGARIAYHFLNTLKLSKGGRTPLSIWTEPIILRGTSPAISDSSHGRETAVTDGTQLGCYFEAKSGPTWTSGKHIARVGKVITLLIGTLNRARHPKKLWRTTGKQEEVFDLLNCGPDNRFTVLSKDGPIIVHNCIQAIARDIMAAAMIRAEKAGFPIVLTVHDELVAEVPERAGNLERFNKVITETPAWAEGCPISAGGLTGKRYRKI